jgi:carotenoid cleavage dioxygenase
MNPTSRINPAGNRYLTGDYTPLEAEYTAFDLPVTGHLPRELQGRWLRNGPNPIVADGRQHHLFMGDAMIHGLALRDGKAQWYRNRWVRHFNASRLLGEPPRKVTVYGGIDQPPNTHVVGHAGRTLALVEFGTQPYELSNELETLGTHDFGGTLPGGYTAHPHWDPATGDMHAMCYFPGMPAIQHVVVNPEGRVTRSEMVPAPNMPMVHDFALTEHHALLFDLPPGFNIEAAMGRAQIPYVWNPEHRPRLGLLPLKGSAADTRWFELPPFWTFHPMNAYEREGQVVVDVVAHPKLCSLYPGSIDNEGLPTFDRFTVDLTSGRVQHQRVDDRPQEFPRINERFTGRPYRWGYSVATEGLIRSFATEDEQALPVVGANQIFKHDLERMTTEVRDYGPGVAVGEPVFVEAENPQSEDHGYLLVTAFNRERNATDLQVLDARAINDEPVACVQLPVRLPLGFHASFVADRP